MDQSDSNMGKILIMAGAVIMLAGLIIHYWGRIPFVGKLPGDLTIEKGNFRLYFPLMTSIILSIVLSLILFLVNKLRN